MDSCAEGRFLLDRFLEAQEPVFETVKRELGAGRKESHWIWYIFPQLEGLVPFPSENTRFYSIKGPAEARAYLNHPILGSRLVECVNAVLAHRDRSALQIFGKVDEQKLFSSATLFAAVSEPSSVFHQLLESHFQGGKDATTLRLLSQPG
ncbi:MAG: DUF1810 domain-containing protein [Planctomycetes bacterium]|jgi:uncharacterized protein (DUF1810 family)|nr:DUF1810 domain-containing protein [Planctomycetota bacterium]